MRRDRNADRCADDAAPFLERIGLLEHGDDLRGDFAQLAAIGNIGQCFTFRLPGYHDDIAAMEATVTALALIAAQDREVLVQSNLDDGFAALFGDLSSSIGAVLLEKHIVETLIGATISHCYGHHFSDPLRRIAFHLALSRVSDAPGTMVYGNTTSYVGTEAQNYASLSAYLQADIHGQHEAPTGHAINPVPVSENDRIPDIDEIIDAQLFAARMIDRAEGYRPLCDLGAAHDMADALVAGGIAFRDRALAGLHAAGIDTDNAFEMLLSLRRIGGRALETAFGSDAAGDGTAIVTSPVVEEVAAIAEQRLARVDPQDRARIAEQNMAVIVATTDVHEHGKLVVERLLRAAGVKVHDGGVSVDADRLVAMARTTSADAIAISTYNGVALDYIGQVFAELDKAELDLPVLIGGRMNQIPDGSNTSLPVDVTAEIATICHTAEDVVPALLATARDGHER